MLEEGKTYTSTEVARLVFDISAKSFSNRRSYYLERMEPYYE